MNIYLEMNWNELKLTELSTVTPSPALVVSRVSISFSVDTLALRRQFKALRAQHLNCLESVQSPHISSRGLKRSLLLSRPHFSRPPCASNWITCCLSLANSWKLLEFLSFLPISSVCTSASLAANRSKPAEIQPSLLTPPVSAESGFAALAKRTPSSAETCRPQPSVTPLEPKHSVRAFKEYT